VRSTNLVRKNGFTKAIQVQNPKKLRCWLAIQTHLRKPDVDRKEKVGKQTDGSFGPLFISLLWSGRFWCSCSFSVCAFSGLTLLQYALLCRWQTLKATTTVSKTRNKKYRTTSKTKGWTFLWERQKQDYLGAWWTKCIWSLNFLDAVDDFSNLKIK